MALVLDIKVTPSSGRVSWKLDTAGMLRVYLKSPPEQGKANLELVKNLAKALGLTQQDVQIVSGATSRNKKVKIMTDLTRKEVLEKLGMSTQLSVLD